MQMGKTPSRDCPEYWNNGDHDWVSIKDLGSYAKYVGKTKETISNLGADRSKIKIVPAGTLVMSFKLSLGKTAITQEPVYTNEAIMAFLDKGKYPIDLDYMYHQFTTKDWTTGTNTAVMGKTLNKSTLGMSYIRIPSIEEQHRVAALLDFVCWQIELAKQQEDKLEKLVKSRFVEMFGDPLENPKHLPIMRIDEIADVQTGATPLRSNAAYYGGSVPWVKTGEVAAGLLEEAEETITELALQETNCKLFPAGTILVAMYGQGDTRGKAAILRQAAATNQACAAILLNEGYDADFILAQLNLRYEDLRSRSLGGNQKNLSLKIIKAYELVVPPIEQQKAFMAFVQQVDKLEFVPNRGSAYPSGFSEVSSHSSSYFPKVARKPSSTSLPMASGSVLMDRFSALPHKRDLNTGSPQL